VDDDGFVHDEGAAALDVVPSRSALGRRAPVIALENGARARAADSGDRPPGGAT